MNQIKLSIVMVLCLMFVGCVMKPFITDDENHKKIRTEIDIENATIRGELEKHIYEAKIVVKELENRIVDNQYRLKKNREYSEEVATEWHMRLEEIELFMDRHNKRWPDLGLKE